MTQACGTYAGYQRATRNRRLGREHCGPCEQCLESARVYNRRPKFNERRARRFRERRKEDSEFRFREHDKQHRTLYGISLVQKKLILAEQGNCCAVCKRSTPGSSRGWFTDHNHTTGEVRGVVCLNCNTFIGHACKSAGSEDPTQLSEYLGERVLHYLREGASRVRSILAAAVIDTFADAAMEAVG